MLRFSIRSLLLFTTAFVAWVLVFTGKSILVTSAGVMLYVAVVLVWGVYYGRAKIDRDEESRRSRDVEESNPTT